MVLPGPPGMSRSEEVHRLTENVYKTIMEQFNPSLRNFISMGKTYEKALASMTYAAKGYFDALVKMGELASESQGSKELGDVLFQMAEVHRQIQNQLEEMLKSFHNELLTQLEQKVELDSRYLSAALKKYQTEQRSKGDSLDKCQAELKKLRKKSQGSKNPQKYSDKELQYIEAISNKQGELENYVSDGYKTALTEERRRFCFLVEKQCAVAKSAITYHAKGKEMLTQKLPLWQQSCSDPNKIPDRAIQLMQQMAASSNGTIMPNPLSTSKSNLIISDPIPGAKPLPVPPELAPFVGRMSAQEAMPVMNGVSGPDSEGYNHWSEMKPAQPKSLSPPQPQKQLSDSYSNTLPVRKNVPPKNSYASAENKTLPRSSSMAAGLERNGRTRVQAIFSHAAGDNSTLLSFKEGDLITLLVPEARDGWHYGESEKTKMRGWFPFSYTRVLDSDGSERVHASLQQGKSSSTGNLLDKDDIAIPPPDYGMASQAFPPQGVNTFKQRPYSVAVPAFSQDYLMPYGCAIKDYSSGLCQPPSAHYKPYTRSTAVSPNASNVALGVYGRLAAFARQPVCLVRGPVSCRAPLLGTRDGDAGRWQERRPADGEEGPVWLAWVPRARHGERVAQNGTVNPQRTTFADSMGASHQKRAVHRQLEAFSLARAD
ncbi:BAR/IMD domain-containing adapter protein 2 isoform X3 [Athene noctua]|uniref:BAR/IMD domain-containing adapter protein 2 isoform X3 n=1 Tax=Athene noctua TaxID=126797 RepID=UPI003EBA6CE0